LKKSASYARLGLNLNNLIYFKNFKIKGAKIAEGTGQKASSFFKKALALFNHLITYK